MATSEIIYLGEFRTQSKHLQSGEIIITDAPTDNNGKGEAFSPTDLVATALGNCMLTLMAMVAERDNIDLSGAKASITKIMASDPRRIAEIHISFNFGNISLSDKHKKLLEHTAHHCPVAKSIHPDIKQVIAFNW